MDRLRNNIVEPFAALFWALGIVCTCHHSNAVQKACTCPYMIIAGSILNEDALLPSPPPFLLVGMLFIFDSLSLLISETHRGECLSDRDANPDLSRAEKICQIRKRF